MSGQQTTQYPAWFTEFGLIPRFPRVGNRAIEDRKIMVRTMRDNAIVKFLRGAKACRILVRTNKKDRTLAIEGRVECDEQLLEHVEKAGFSFVNAFYLSLGKVEKNTYRSDLRKIVASLFAETWDRYIDAQFGRHPDPDIKKAYEDVRHAIRQELQEMRSPDNGTKTNSGNKRGKKKTVDFDVMDRNVRYERILEATEHLHKMASMASQLSLERDEKKETRPRDAIENQVQSLRRVIYEMSHSEIPPEYHHWIFSGAAFKEIPVPENRGVPSSRPARQMHEPRTWKPHQLAISLLKLDSGEEGISYQSLAREIRPTKFLRSC
ncbi:MAG TPA: hypothetical protein VGJ06_20545 [Candidatus Acidoferrum sp.]|jgi:hypothetical protein